MATKYTCDRCDREFLDKDAVATIVYPTWQQYTREIENFPTSRKDLCIDCIRGLGEFMKPLPKASSGV